jgi:uncharacterized phage protein gp47/JayE
MSFEPRKYKDIFDDMRGRTTVVTDFEVGSVTRTLMESFAYEIALLYEKMNLVYLSAYVDTAEGQQLDNVVAILGVQRGLPDFAEGTVAFLRDVGNQRIEIPLGTLVSTEDAPDSPKKVYQTQEAKTLPADHTSVDVKVQAVNRGEDEVTPAEAITVMPRPLPGIKSVINRGATIFTGKRRETDDELRKRAKNALISSGKASVLAIENALLSQPAVKDVKVDETFRNARGTVHLHRAEPSEPVRVPKGTRLTAIAGSESKSFTTTTMVKMEAGATDIDVSVEAVLEGEAGEMAAGATWTIDGNGDLAGVTATNAESIVLGQFGVVDVTVDGVDLTDPAEAARIRQEIDRVRAAGIFVRLAQTTRIDVDAVFRVELAPELALSGDERLALEGRVQAVIVKYIDELRMGQPILFAQIVKAVLSVDGVVDLADFAVTTRKPDAGGAVVFQFVPADKRIEIEDAEKLNPGHVCVASEVKPLPVDIEVKAASGSLTAGLLGALQGALAAYFASLKVGDAVDRGAVTAAIAGAGVTLDGDLLSLSAEPWCAREPAEDANVVVSFVEQPQLGAVFAYHDFLDITGALALTLPPSMTGSEKQAVRLAVQSGIERYLDGLAPEADVVLDDLVDIATSVDRVLDADVDRRDFRVAVNGAPLPARITADKLNVEAFEKARLDRFCITGDVEVVTVAVTSVAIELLLPTGASADGPTAAIKLALRNTINNYLAGAVPGDDVVFDDLRGALDNAVPGVNYNLTALALTATSAGDGREQATSLASGADLHVRSVEVATMAPITDDDITVTVTEIAT